jgi:sialidase-1
MFLALLLLVVPTATKQDLFVSGEQGYALMRIPGIIATAKGTLLAYAEARKSASGDWGATDVVLRRSTDGGGTWSPLRVISRVPHGQTKNQVALEHKIGREGEITCNNPLAIADRDGSVHFIYTVENERVFYLRSQDDGISFGEPTEITAVFEGYRPHYAWRVVAPGPGHGIQLRSGRLLGAFWMSTGTGGHGHRPSVVATIYSDNGGRTWQRGEIALRHGDTIVNPSETVLAELLDGRVLLNARTESHAHRRVISTSRDGTGGWSEPAFHEQLLEPVCMASLARHGKFLLFVNPDNLRREDGRETPGSNRDRRNLTIQVSGDEGKTWGWKRVIEEGFSAYSDLAVLPDGTICVLYERGAQGVNHFQPAALTLARFPLSWAIESVR